MATGTLAQHVAVVNGGGVLVTGRGVAGAARDDVGVYTVTIDTALTAQMPVIVTPNNAEPVTVGAEQISATEFKVYTFDATGSPADSTFSFVAYRY